MVEMHTAENTILISFQIKASGCEMIARYFNVEGFYVGE